MDTETSLIVFGVAAAVANKVLGPTADYLGEGLRGMVEHRRANLTRIMARAQAKLGNRIDEDGTVPPRVLGRIIDEGSYCSDAIATEYLGGILASSRSGIPRDDRGVGMVALIGRLSTYQLRMHYILYSALYDLRPGDEFVNFGVVQDRERFTVFIPIDDVVNAMDFTDDENRDLLIGHSIFGLAKEGLVSENNYGFGPPTFLITLGVPISAGYGVVFRPSVVGIELFLWAHGRSDIPGGALFSARDLISDLPIPRTPRATTVAQLNEEEGSANS